MVHLLVERGENAIGSSTKFVKSIDKSIANMV